MCSIFGAVGPRIVHHRWQRLITNAKDRGRDGGNLEFYDFRHQVTPDGWRDFEAALGNWRAVPTPEIQVAPFQPYDRLVHNGTIANDKELGGRPGEVDSMVLSRVLDRTDVQTLARDLSKVRGSYALATFNGKTVLGATNYKPLHYAVIDDTVYFSSMARHFEGVLPFGVGPVALPPYTAIDFLSRVQVPIYQRDGKRAVVIASAGLDSTVAATSLVRDGWDVHLLHFAYGCNAEFAEIQRVSRIAEALRCERTILGIDLKAMLGLTSSRLFQDQSLTSGAVEGAEFAHEWVPGRNLVFIALATAWAEAHGYHAVALGNNLEEAGAYPDNEEEFTTLLNKALPYAVQAHYGMRLLTPVGNLMKHEIVKKGLQLNAPFEHTWSCYRGGVVHCGECGPCFMRRKAFERSGGIDPVFV